MGPGIALPVSGIDLVPAETAQLNLHGGGRQPLEERLRKMTYPEIKILSNYSIQKLYTLIF